jgi:hypothetical protein
MMVCGFKLISSRYMAIFVNMIHMCTSVCVSHLESNSCLLSHSLMKVL